MPAALQSGAAYFNEKVSLLRGVLCKNINEKIMIVQDPAPRRYQLFRAGTEYFQIDERQIIFRLRR